MAIRPFPSFRFQQLNRAYQSDPRRILGQQLNQAGVSAAPVATPLQGLGRLAQALVGAKLQRDAIDAQAKREDDLTNQITSMIPENANPNMRSYALAFPGAFSNALASNLLQPTTSSEVVNLGGNLRGVQTTQTGPFGRTSTAISNLTQIKPETQTTAQRNALALGLVPGTDDYNKYIKEATGKSGTNININQKTETVAAQEAAKDGISQISALRKEVRSERDLVGRLDISLALLEGDTETGPLTQLITPFKSLGKQLGFLNDEQIKNLSNTEILRAAFAYQIPRMRVPGSGATSDFEAKLFSQATANMSNTPEANKVLILGMKKLAERKREILDLQEKYFKKNFNLLGFSNFEEQKTKPIFQKYDTDQQYDKAINTGELKKGDLYYNGKTKTFEIVE